MERVKRTCPTCGNSLELTPLNDFVGKDYLYCDTCCKAIDLNGPEALFTNFNRMHLGCVKLREKLYTDFNILVSEEGRAYEIIGWPGMGENKLYERHCGAKFGKEFLRDGEIITHFTKEEYNAVLEYIKQVRMSKTYGQNLTTYAELIDMYRSKNLVPEGKIFKELIFEMRTLYALAPEQCEDVKIKKRRSLRKEGK